MPSPDKRERKIGVHGFSPIACADWEELRTLLAEKEKELEELELERRESVDELATELANERTEHNACQQRLRRVEEVIRDFPMLDDDKARLFVALADPEKPDA